MHHAHDSTSTPQAVLVTGGAGFIGRNVVRRLLSRSVRVTVLARTDRQARALFGDSVGVVAHDLTSSPFPRSALRGVDAVVHCAGMPRPARVGALEAIHIGAVEKLINALRDTGAPRLIHIASDAVVFDGRPLIDIDESHPYPQRFVDAYSRTKAAGEQLVLEAANRGDITAISLRPSLVWGPDDSTFLPLLARFANSVVGMPIAGKGDQLEETTYIGNLVDAVMAALNAPITGRAYFIADGYSMRWRPFYTQVLESVGVRPRFFPVPAPLAIAGAWFADSCAQALHLPTPLARFGVHRVLTSRRYRTDAAARDLAWKPRVDFATGLAELRAWAVTAEFARARQPRVATSSVRT